MAKYPSIDAIVANVNNCVKIVDNVAYDDNNFLDYPDPGFTWCGYSLDTMWINGNSYISFNGSEGTSFKVNRTDAKMWNLWRETGLVGSNKFLRYRWSGYTRYSSTDPSYFLTYDLIFVDNDRIYLHLVNVPVNNWNYETRLYIGGNGYARVDTLPGYGTTELDFTVYKTGDTINTFTAKAGFDSFLEHYYLIKNLVDNKIYTYQNGSYVEVTGTLSEAVFLQQGLREIPPSLPNNFQLLVFSQSDDIDPTIDLVGDIIIPSSENKAVYHITSIAGQYKETYVDTDGTVYYSSDGTNWSETDNLSDHSNYYIKVVFGTYLNGIEVRCIV